MGEGKAEYERRRQIEKAADDLARQRARLRTAQNDLAEETVMLALAAVRDFLAGKAHLLIEDGDTPGVQRVYFERD